MAADTSVESKVRNLLGKVIPGNAKPSEPLRRAVGGCPQG
jgi:hypothetical protein